MKDLHMFSPTGKKSKRMFIYMKKGAYLSHFCAYESFHRNALFSDNGGNPYLYGGHSQSVLLFLILSDHCLFALICITDQ